MTCIGLETDAGLYESPRWLAVERAVATYPPLELTVAGRASASAYRFDATSNPWPAARIDLFLRRLGITEQARAELLPSFLLGGRRPGHSRIAVQHGPYRSALLTEVIAAAADAARTAGGATLAMLYCERDDLDLARAWRNVGGRSWTSLANNVLTLPGSHPDDWLASLGHKQRSNERADARKLAAAGIEYAVRPLEVADLDWIVPLELGLYEKYGTSYQEEEARRLHEAYLVHLGTDAQLIVASRGGRRVGFASLVRHGESAYLRQGGFDHVACDGAPVYFGALFHAAISWAYEVGVRSLDYSTSAEAPKRHRGCVAQPRIAWVLPLTTAATEALDTFAA